MARPPAVRNGKDIGMPLLFRKSSSCWTAILLWLVVSFAGQLLSGPPQVAAPGAAPPPGKTNAAQDTQVDSRLRNAQTNEESTLSLSQKQKKDLLKSNFEKMKRDAGELADLAKALQDQLNKSNENILSLDIVDKADKIERLAKRIKTTARGF
jgi:acyl-CoA reductase-like NAD-dependent aldehyde dehydrogenase